MNIQEIKILTKVGGWNMSHLPSEMAAASYTFGQGAVCWEPIPTDEVTDEMSGDVEGSGSPRSMTLDEAIEVDQDQICYFNRTGAEEQLKNAIASLDAHRTLKNWKWKGLIPAETKHCLALINQLNSNCHLHQLCSYQLKMEEARSLGIGEDGKIYVFSLDPQSDYAMLLGEEQGFDG